MYDPFDQYWTPPKSLDEVRDAIASRRDLNGVASDANLMLRMVTWRKVYHYAVNPGSKGATQANFTAVDNARKMGILYDALALWSLRQLLRQSMTEKAISSLIKSIIGHPPRSEADIEMADRHSDPFVRRWDVGLLELALDKMKQGEDLLAGTSSVIRRRQIVDIVLRLKIATQCAKNVRVLDKEAVLKVCLQSVNDFDYSVGVVSENSLLALMAPSTNHAGLMLKRLEGVPLKAPEKEPPLPPVDSNPILMMPSPVMSVVPEVRPARKKPEPPNLPARMISLD